MARPSRDRSLPHPDTGAIRALGHGRRASPARLHASRPARRRARPAAARLTRGRLDASRRAAGSASTAWSSRAAPTSTPTLTVRRAPRDRHHRPGARRVRDGARPSARSSATCRCWASAAACRCSTSPRGGTLIEHMPETSSATRTTATTAARPVAPTTQVRLGARLAGGARGGRDAHTDGQVPPPPGRRPRRRAAAPSPAGLTRDDLPEAMECPDAPLRPRRAVASRGRRALAADRGARGRGPQPPMKAVEEPPHVTLRQDRYAHEHVVFAFPYRPDVVDAVRAIPGRRFDWEARRVVGAAGRTRPPRPPSRASWRSTTGSKPPRTSRHGWRGPSAAGSAR